ncbi:hypothetical protein ACTFIR_003446 [Dictyostelium discoideum]
MTAPTQLNISDGEINSDLKENYKDNSDNKNENIKKNKKTMVGIFIIILIAFGSTGNSELQSFMFTDNFNSPFMIMWFNTSFLSFSFLIELIYLKFQLNNPQLQNKILNNNNNNDNNNKINFKTSYL